MEEDLIRAYLDTPAWENTYLSKVKLSDDPLRMEMRKSLTKLSENIANNMNKITNAQHQIKNMSRRKRNKIKLVNRRQRLKSFGIDDDMIERIKQKVKAKQQQQQEKTLIKNIDTNQLATKEDIKQIIDMIKQQNVLIQANQKEEKSVSMTLQDMFEKTNSSNAFFIYSDVAENFLKMAYSPLNNTVKYFQGTDTNFSKSIYDFISSWSKASMLSIKEILYRTTRMGFNINKFVVYLFPTNWGEIPSLLTTMLVDFIYLFMASMMLVTNLLVVHALILFADVLFGSSYSTSFQIIVEEYMSFISSILVDASMLPVRVFSYLIFGVDPTNGKAIDMFRSNMRMFYVFKSIWDFVAGSSMQFFDQLVKDPSINVIFTKGKWVYEKISIIFQYLLSLSVKVGKTAKKVFEFVYENGPMIGNQIRKALPHFTQSIKNIAFESVGRLQSLFQTPNLALTNGQAMRRLGREIKGEMADRPYNVYEVVYLLHQPMPLKF